MYGRLHQKIRPRTLASSPHSLPVSRDTHPPQTPPATNSPLPLSETEKKYALLPFATEQSPQRSLKQLRSLSFPANCWTELSCRPINQSLEATPLTKQPARKLQSAPAPKRRSQAKEQQTAQTSSARLIVPFGCLFACLLALSLARSPVLVVRWPAKRRGATSALRKCKSRESQAKSSRLWYFSEAWHLCAHSLAGLWVTVKGSSGACRGWILAVVRNTDATWNASTFFWAWFFAGWLACPKEDVPLGLCCCDVRSARRGAVLPLICFALPLAGRPIDSARQWPPSVASRGFANKAALVWRREREREREREKS